MQLGGAFDARACRRAREQVSHDYRIPTESDHYVAVVCVIACAARRNFYGAGPRHEVAKATRIRTSKSTGGAIHTTKPIQNLKSLGVNAIGSATNGGLPVFFTTNMNVPALLRFLTTPLALPAYCPALWVLSLTWA